MSDLMKAKAYKLLMEQYRSTMASIISLANRKSQYANAEEQQEALKLIGLYGNSRKPQWDKHGIQSQGEANLIETLEYILNDQTLLKP
jgi:hypothetical protein